MRHHVMVMRRTASLALLLVVSLVGCGEGAQSALSTPERSTASATLECENGMRNVGEPDYAMGSQPNTEAPLSQARTFIEGSHMRRDYPDVEAVVAAQQPSRQIIALVSEGKSAGILRYDNDEDLGWYLATVETCSPSR